MRKSIFTKFLIALTVFILTATTCFSQSGSGGKTINSAKALEEYLDSQPANSPDKPIKVSMGANELMLPKIRDVLNYADKYVSLNLTGDALTIIPAGAFKGCKTLVSITIPNSVTRIENAAFSGCTSLTSITIPNNVTSIGGSAFSGCTSLTNVTIPNSVTRIENAAFSGCTSLTNVTIPNSVTRIEWGAFKRCNSLTSITIHNSITEIGQHAFEDCISLISVTIGSGVIWIGDSAFFGCKKLASVTFQGTITANNFGSYTYYNVTYKEYTDFVLPFHGDLDKKYLAGGPGTYTTTAPVNDKSVWTKK